MLRLQSVFSGGALIEIDHYGGRLIGCVKCNRWGRPGDKRLVMELMEEDIEALRKTPHNHQYQLDAIKAVGFKCLPHHA